MKSGTLALIGGIILEGMKGWNESRRARFSAKYENVLDRLNAAENAQRPEYTDAELMLSQEDLEKFLEAYKLEFQLHNMEARNA